MHGPSTLRNSDRDRMSQAEPPVRHFNKTEGGKDTVVFAVRVAGPATCAYRQRTRQVGSTDGPNYLSLLHRGATRQ